MIYKLNTPCKSGEILQEFRLTPIQSECSITSVANIDSIQSGSLAFWSGGPSQIESLLGKNTRGAMIFIKTLPKTSNKNDTYIVVENPRLAFIKVLQYLERTKGFEQEIKHSISTAAQVHKTAVIEHGVHIGPGSNIGPHVHIYRGVSIGENCIIGNGASIGKSGFSFERDEQGNPQHFPHLGAVKIGNNVEIGANTCISKGVLQDTIIENHVKIDDLVYLAHNCHIGEQTMIISGATLCGGVTVGKQTWIGASASIRQNLSVGDNATVGFGAVVTKNIEANTIVAGNPASIMEQQH